MSRTLTNFTIGRRLLAILAVATACSGSSHAQIAKIGDIQVLPVINVSLRVGGAGKEAKTTTYSPPPGWHIRSHEVKCTHRHGITSYAVSTVPAGWAWLSEQQSNEMHQRLVDMAAKSRDVDAQLKLNVKQDDAFYDMLRANAGQHALILETSATGAGYLRGGSGIDVTVFAEMVYIGIDHSPIFLPLLGIPPPNERIFHQGRGSK